jgi:hypothetical protein
MPKNCAPPALRAAPFTEPVLIFTTNGSFCAFATGGCAVIEARNTMAAHLTHLSHLDLSSRFMPHPSTN